VKVRTVNDQDLDRAVVAAKGFLVVAFLSPDSIPSRHYVPEFEAVAEAFARRVAFLRIDALENPTAADDYGIEAVPTTVVFRDGEEVKRYEGPYNRVAIAGRLREILLVKRGKETSSKPGSSASPGDGMKTPSLGWRNTNQVPGAQSAGTNSTPWWDL
jgi:thioredoxin-like negative regulator of GroEL